MPIKFHGMRQVLRLSEALTGDDAKDLFASLPEHLREECRREWMKSKKRVTEIIGEREEIGDEDRLDDFRVLARKMLNDDE